jgi:hypothetical protein
MEGLRKAMKNFSQDIPGRVSNQIPAKYKSDALLLLLLQTFRFYSVILLDMRFVMDKVATGQVSFQVSLVFTYKSSFHHCSILPYHNSLRCTIALTWHHIITSPAFRSEVSSLTLQLAGYKIRK